MQDFPSIKVKEEIWMPLQDYGYDVSSYGNVRRVKSSRGTNVFKPVNPSFDRYGRQVFNVSKNGKVKQFKIHRAVMLAFCGVCPEGKEVAHLDGNQSNNVLSNLIYATPKENNGHKLLHGTQPKGETVWASKLNEAQVLDIRASHPDLSYSKIAKKHGVHIQTIAAIITRRNWKHV